MPLDQKCQSRRLHATDGKQRTVADGIGACGIHANDPVRPGTAFRTFVKSVVMGAVLQFRQSFLDRFVRHGGNPKPLERLFALGVGIDPAEDQFAFTPCICCADQAFGLFIVDQFFDDIKLLLPAADDLQGDILRQDGQIFCLPAGEFFIQFFRFHLTDQVTQCPGDHVAVTFQIPFAFFCAAQNPRDLPRDTGFFSYNDQSCHRYSLILW